MQLTTPEAVNFDPVFPGENWFFYWRSSPSLWRAKLQSYSGVNPIFVPLNWGLHSEYIDQYDFGEHKPESDLKKIVEIANSVGKKLVFLLPLSPVPFLPNGGVPSYLARHHSTDENGMHRGAIDYNGTLNKLYTFFDPRTFQGFQKFVMNIGQYFSTQGIPCELYGLDAYSGNTNGISSLFDDSGAIFKNGLKRYIKQLQETEPEKIEKLIAQPNYEKELSLEYTELLKGLYLEAAKEHNCANWEGVLKVAFLGCSTKDLFLRSARMWESSKDYFAPFLKSFSSGYLPSSILLDPELKKEILSKFFKSSYTTSSLWDHMHSEYYDEDTSLDLNPLINFEIFRNKKNHCLEKNMQNSGLQYFINNEYPWQYQISTTSPGDFEELAIDKIYTFFGKDLSINNLNNIFKLFMNGHKVLFDLSHVGDDILRKLEVFKVENGLKIEKINFVSPMEKITLGDGAIITFESEKLHIASLLKRNEFWETVINYIGTKQIKIEADEDIIYFWQSRGSSTYELSFEEIRRVNLYNPSSYKRKVSVLPSQSFAFIKSVDQVNADIKSTPLGVEVLLMPGSSASLDFGQYA